MKNPITIEPRKGIRGKTIGYVARLGRAHADAGTKEGAVAQLFAHIDALAEESYNVHARIAKDGSVFVLTCSGADTPTHRRYCYQRFYHSQLKNSDRDTAWGGSTSFSAKTYREARERMDADVANYNEVT